MRRVPGALRRRAATVGRGASDLRRHRAIRAGRPAVGRPAVYYGHDRLPTRAEVARGGTIKFQQLERVIPNEPGAFNVLYLGSSTRPHDSSALLRLAQERRAAIVLNQNGVAYPGWHGAGWEQTNEPLRELLQAADHVLYQSEFCRLSADRFLGEPKGNWEILHNPVDTTLFTPGEPPNGPLTILLGGNQYQRYRFESALWAFELVRTERQARLLVAGRLSWTADSRHAEREAADLIARSDAGRDVELVGSFSQLEAPALYRRSHLLLHTKYNDPCPTVVLEAMACGLPVVYSASGGTPELVGPDAGVGIPAPLDWDRDQPPAPEALADALVQAAERREELGAAGLQRARDRFDLEPWIERHRRLFGELIA